jgi:hypothetical protein
MESHNIDTRCEAKIHASLSNSERCTAGKNIFAGYFFKNVFS